ncbi:uncharacterized protein [Ptychodera flava]|uniref:uncharacterized protein n=1 Tax=Ptychodera flava TaxID=63121 RepID=UPI00396A0765
MIHNWALAILIVFRSICLSKEVVYRDTPEDTIVMLHDTTQLNCSFDVSPPNVEWADSTGGISIGYNLFREGFEVVGDASADEYNLRIDSASLNEEDYYECRDYANNSISESAYVYVVAGGPECSANPGYTVIEHEEANFTCTISKAVPPGEMI